MDVLAICTYIAQLTTFGINCLYITIEKFGKTFLKNL